MRWNFSIVDYTLGEKLSSLDNYQKPKLQLKNYMDVNIIVCTISNLKSPISTRKNDLSSRFLVVIVILNINSNERKHFRYSCFRICFAKLLKLPLIFLGHRTHNFLIVIKCSCLMFVFRILISIIVLDLYFR